MAENLNPMPDSFVTRHTFSFKENRGLIESSEYKGITEAGVELAREKAKSIYDHMKNGTGDTIFFMAGSSELIRSKSTLRVYADTLKQMSADEDSDELFVISEDDVVSSGKSFSERVQAVTEMIKANSNKKIVVVSPLAMSGFGIKGVWDGENGDQSYLNEISKQNGDNDTDIIRFWFENFREDRGEERGVLHVDGKVLRGPDPKEVAEAQIESINRLKEFVTKNVGDRPVEIGSVGHAFNLSALAVYLSNHGEVTAEAFDKIGGVIEETELITLRSDQEGQTLRYGNRLEENEA